MSRSYRFVMGLDTGMLCWNHMDLLSGSVIGML